MTFVMSDLHGDLARYEQMLKKIHFGDNDILYVLGDTVDHGEDSVALLTEMSMSPNVYPIAGEHDLTALRMLNGFVSMLRDGATPDPAYVSEMTAWAKEGGNVTLEGFRELDEDMREGVLDYLSEFSLYEEVEAGGKSFVLVHAGIDGFASDKELDEYEPAAFFTPAPSGARFFEDRVLIVGHQPTKSGRIERDGGVIRLNCGAAQGGALACLCLETDEEFYV